MHQEIKNLSSYLCHDQKHVWRHLDFLLTHLLPLFLAGKSKSGIKYKGTIEVPNLSDENDMEDLDVSFRHINPRVVKQTGCWCSSCDLCSDFCIIEQRWTRHATDQPDENERSWESPRGPGKLRGVPKNRRVKPDSVWNVVKDKN